MQMMNKFLNLAKLLILHCTSARLTENVKEKKGALLYVKKICITRTSHKNESH